MFVKQLLLACSLLAISAEPPQAHDIYSHLVDDRGDACCDNTDCRPAHYRFSFSGVEMFVYSQWFAVPPHMVQYRALPGDTGETRGGHWCGSFGSDAPGAIALIYTRCAILPPQAASVAHIIAQ
jgi:hypothetical protein